MSICIAQHHAFCRLFFSDFRCSSIVPGRRCPKRSWRPDLESLLHVPVPHGDTHQPPRSTEHVANMPSWVAHSPARLTTNQTPSYSLMWPPCMCRHLPSAMPHKASGLHRTSYDSNPRDHSPRLIYLTTCLLISLSLTTSVRWPPASEYPVSYVPHHWRSLVRHNGACSVILQRPWPSMACETRILHCRSVHLVAETWDLLKKCASKSHLLYGAK